MSQLKKRKSRALPLEQQYQNSTPSLRHKKNRLIKQQDDHNYDDDAELEDVNDFNEDCQDDDDDDEDDESYNYDELDNHVEQICQRKKKDKTQGFFNSEFKSENSSSQQKSGQQRASNNNSCKKASNGSSMRNQKYQKIHDDVRAEILFRSMVMNEPLKALCKELNINFSSAKNVIQVYKKEGRLNKKTSRLKRTEKGELVERMDQISDDVINELKKKRCPVKVVRESIHGEIQIERNDEIYVPLSGRSGYDCIKVKQEISQQLREFKDDDFNRILLIAQRELAMYKNS